jgi:pimeloyl-ACP methyl ester carboxylesterase
MTSIARMGRDELRLALAAPAPAGGWESRWVRVAGVPTHYRARSVPSPAATAGAVPVVMLHGLAVSHRYLMPTADALADRHPVLVPDLPGFGLSGKPAMAYDVRRHADHVAGWLDTLALPPVCVLGHSFGAEVAAALAAAYPGRVAALVLAGPTTDATARSRRGQIRRWVGDLAVEDPRQAAILARDVYDAGPRRVWATLSHSVRNRIEDDVRAATAPTLVIGGERDPVAPRRWRALTGLLAAHPTAVTVPGAGHNAVTTAGRPVADAVAAFLAGALPAPCDPASSPADPASTPADGVPGAHAFR